MATSERTRPRIAVSTWTLRIVWCALPIALGSAVGPALEPWARAPRMVAEAMLWLSWAAGLVAVLAPRPVGLSVIRAGSITSIGVALATVPDADTESATVAVVAALAAAVLTHIDETATDFVNGSTYGDERRFTLRHPWLIGALLAPAGTILVVGGVATGPLLIADGRIGAGVAAIGVGTPVAAWFSRSLHTLSRRWLVFVPGGVVIHDPLVLSHAVLAPRTEVREFAPVVPGEAPGEFLDLRLGVRGGELMIEVNEALSFPRSSRRQVDLVQATRVIVCPARLGAVVTEAARRGIPRSSTR